MHQSGLTSGHLGAERRVEVKAEILGYSGLTPRKENRNVRGRTVR